MTSAAPPAPRKVCGACGTLAETAKPFCPECGTTYGQPGGGTAPTVVYSAFGSAAIALFFFPIVFGPVAIVLAGIAMSRKEPHAALALGLAVAAMVLGMILGVLFYA